LHVNGSETTGSLSLPSHERVIFDILRTNVRHAIPTITLASFILSLRGTRLNVLLVCLLAGSVSGLSVSHRAGYHPLFCYVLDRTESPRGVFVTAAVLF